jgi:hypothetical protein
MREHKVAVVAELRKVPMQPADEAAIILHMQHAA